MYQPYSGGFIKRLQTWLEISEKYAYVSSTGNRTGVITAGLPYLSLLDVLGENAE